MCTTDDFELSVCVKPSVVVSLRSQDVDLGADTPPIGGADTPPI